MQVMEKSTSNDFCDAELFLMMLYDSREFRDSVIGSSSQLELDKLLDDCNFSFDTYQLAKVLAEFVTREIETSEEITISKINEFLSELF